RAHVYDNGNGEAVIHKGGAGAVCYAFGIPEKRGATVLNAVSPGATYELVRPGGGKDIFQTIYAPAGGRIFYFLTQRVDPQGNAITFNYTTNSGIFRLSTVADADGKSFTLYYENGTFSNRVTKVVDPFLRTNILTYDE